MYTATSHTVIVAALLQRQLESHHYETTLHRDD